MGEMTTEEMTDELTKIAEPLFKWQRDRDAAADKYIDLSDVLRRAYEQAATGKGAARHGQGQPFNQQPMQRLCDLYGRGFALGQAAKKIQEAQRLEPDAAIREMLGAINYIAGAVIHLEAETAGGV